MMRLSLPPLPFLDGDGYSNLASDYFAGRRLSYHEARGIYYPIFVLLNMLIGGNVNAVALCQHLLAVAGLIIIGFTFYGMEAKGCSTVKNLSVLLALLFLGWNYALITLEHSIGPEGLGIIFTACIFYLLQKLLAKPRFAFYAALVFVNILMFLTHAKFILGNLFIIFCGTWLYVKAGPIKTKNARQALIGLIVCFGALYGFQNLFPSDVGVRSLLATNYFYVNCRVIEHSKGLESHFTPDEKNAIETAVNQKAGDSTAWPLIGFNADKLMSGPIADTIESRYGYRIYNRVMLKSLVYCFPELALKALGQMKEYYFGNKLSERIPRYWSLGYNTRLADDVSNLMQNTDALPAWKIDYIHAANKYLSRPNRETGVSNCAWIAWRCAMLLSIWVFIFTAIYSAVQLVKGRMEIVMVFLAAHFLILLTVTTVHTLDLGRYSVALFPFFALILLLGLRQMTLTVCDCLRALSGKAKPHDS